MSIKLDNVDKINKVHKISFIGTFFYLRSIDIEGL